MRKVLILVFIPVLLGVLFLSSSLISAAPVEINYYTWQDPTFQPIVDAYNASQSEVVVKVVALPSSDYETKLMTLLAGGADIDCYMQKRQTDMFQQSKNGFIEPLNKYIRKYKYNSKAIDAYLSQVSIKFKGVMAIPYRGSGYYTYYNKKIFAKAGLPTPTDYVKKGEWNWDKFIEVTKKLSTGDGKQYGAIMYTWGQISLIPAVQNNCLFIDSFGRIKLDEKAIAKSIKMRRDLERSKSIVGLTELKATKTHYSKLFYEGNSAMLLIGEWFPGFMINGRTNNLLKDYAWNDWAITRLPCDNAKYTTMGACTFNHISSRSKKKDAAFKFIAWMGSPEGGKFIARNGILPPIVDAAVKEELTKVVPDAESVDYLIERSTPRIAPWYTEYGTRVQLVIEPLLEKYLSSNMTEEEFLTELKAQLKQIVATTPKN